MRGNALSIIQAPSSHRAPFLPNCIPWNVAAGSVAARACPEPGEVGLPRSGVLWTAVARTHFDTVDMPKHAVCDHGESANPEDCMKC